MGEITSREEVYRGEGSLSATLVTMNDQEAQDVVSRILSLAERYGAR